MSRRRPAGPVRAAAAAEAEEAEEEEEEEEEEEPYTGHTPACRQNQHTLRLPTWDGCSLSVILPDPNLNMSLPWSHAR